MARTAEKSSSDPNPPPSTPPSRTDGTPTASTSSSSSYLSSTLMVIALCIGALACSSKYIGALQTSGVPFPSGLLSPSSWRDFQWLESLSSYLMPCSFNPYATPTSKLKQKKQKLPKEAVIPPKVNARHVTAAELAKHGATSRRIWISLLGHVYDGTRPPSIHRISSSQLVTDTVSHTIVTKLSRPFHFLSNSYDWPEALWPPGRLRVLFWQGWVEGVLHRCVICEHHGSCTCTCMYMETPYTYFLLIIIKLTSHNTSRGV